MQARNIPVHGETVNPVQSRFPSFDTVDGQNLAFTLMSYSLNSLKKYLLDSLGDYCRGYKGDTRSLEWLIYMKIGKYGAIV